MVCGYGDKVSAGNSAAPLMPFQLICGHFLYTCRSKGITGKDVTPFLLQKLTELTDGKSLDSSILLLSGGKKESTPVYFLSLLIMPGRKHCHFTDGLARSKHFSVCEEMRV